MAVRGAESKNKIISDMIEKFPGSFIAADGKTLRIPMTENGEPIEIKVTLVAAKDLEGGTISFQSENEDGDLDDQMSGFCENNSAIDVPEPTEEEKEKINKLLTSLNIK